MKGKKDLWIIIISSVSFFLLLNLLTGYYFELPLSYTLFIGKSSYGTVQLFVQSQNSSITIYSPTNRSYDFDVGEDYNISLNVGADFDATAWNYSLYDLRHDDWIYQDVAFTPNTTFIVVRWSNRLDVVATEGSSKSATASVTFFVLVPNTSPIIDTLEDPILVCEDTSLDYRFNVTDADEDDLTGSIYPTGSPFYLFKVGDNGYNITTFRLFSQDGNLDYGSVGNYSRNITVDDGNNHTDMAEANIEVIEVNDVPVAEDISTQTVYYNGTGKSLEYQWDVTDEEDGTSLEGNLNFNISFSGGVLFGINGTGFMNYTPKPDEEGTYLVTVCAEDNGISDVHPNISFCTGQQATSLSACEDFTLIVTDENRAPNITDYYPANLSFSVRGNVPTRFNVSAVDPDGANPDISWSVDGNREQWSEGVNTSTFWYTFDCDFSGTQTVLVNATDGDLDDTVTWSVNVLYGDCPSGGNEPPPNSGGGGGGGGGGDGSSCYEDWICQGWGVCQNVEEFFSLGKLNLEDYSYLREVCLQNQYLGISCGFQEEICYDLNGCNNTVPNIANPSEKRGCYYTPEPSCSDEILNCHDGGCEVLVDCGGPCQACPTCTDGIRNQGESGIDCGGPCPTVCPYEEPKAKINFFWIWLLLLLLIILLFIIYKILKIFGYFPVDEKKEKKIEKKVMRKIRGREKLAEILQSKFGSA